MDTICEAVMRMRYRELYDRGKEILESVPIPDAALDARLLLEKACGTDLQTLLVSPDRPVSEEESRRYLDLIERRRLREPTAMILGEWDFMGLTFKVTKDTLIPEQDTEVLVETVLDRMHKVHPCSRTGKLPCRKAGDYSERPSSGRTGMERTDPDSCAEAGRDESRLFLTGDPLILDLCTGSGCILLSLLHEWPFAKGIGTDISEKALATARENAAALRLSERAIWRRGDLWDALPGESGPDATRAGTEQEPISQLRTEAEGSSRDRTEAEINLQSRIESEANLRVRTEQEAGSQAQTGPAAIRPCLAAFDLIVSNPPYVPTAVIPTLEPEVRCGEPYAALDGGPDGLAFYRRIIDRAAGYLKEDGLLALESGFDEAGQICALLERAGYTDIRIDRDYGGRERVVSARAGRPAL